MTGSEVVLVPGLNSVCISYSAFSLEPEYPLKLSYILLGLYQGILEMTR